MKSDVDVIGLYLSIVFLSIISSEEGSRIT
jgi:hypothetical protein